MTDLFSSCFGKGSGQKNSKISPQNVTKVKPKDNRRIRKAFEDSLVAARESRDVNCLENALEEAASSGLLTRSDVFIKEQARLRTWKQAKARLSSFLKSSDMTSLRAVRTDYQELGLIDEDGLLESADAAIKVLQAKQHLNSALNGETETGLESAISRCEEIRGDDLQTLSAELAAAKSFLTKIQEEQRIFRDNDKYPEQELDKSIESRKLSQLKEAISRWKRLKLDLKHPTFIEAKTLLEEEIGGKRKRAILGLKHNVKCRNLEKTKRYLHKVKKYDGEPDLVDGIRDKVIPSLQQIVSFTSDVIVALRNRDYTSVSKLNANPCEITDFEPNSKQGKRSGDENAAVISDALTAMKEHSKGVALSAQVAVRAFKIVGTALDAMEITLNETCRQFEQLSEKYKACGEASVGESQESFGCLRQEEWEVKSNEGDRSLMVAELCRVMGGQSEKVTKASAALRSSLRFLENARTQSLKRILLLEKATTDCETNTNHKNDYDSALEKAEAVLRVFARYEVITRSETSLRLFIGVKDTTSSRSEVEKVAANLELGLNELAADSSGINSHFVDLCYNGPGWSQNDFKTGEKRDPLLIILRCLSVLFPERYVANLRKAAGVRLAEIRILGAESQSKENAARYELHKAVLSGNEVELTRAIGRCHLSQNDEALLEAKGELSRIRENKRACLDALRKAVLEANRSDLETNLRLAEKLYISPIHQVVLRAKCELADVEFRQVRREEARRELEELLAAEGNPHDVTRALARAQVCRVPPEDVSLTSALALLDAASVKEAGSLRKRFRDVEVAFRVISDKDIEDKSLGNSHLDGPRLEMVPGNDSPAERLEEILKCEVTNVGNGGCVDAGYVTIKKILDMLDADQHHIDPGVIEESKQAITDTDEKRLKVEEMKNKLKVALTEDSKEPLASAIASVDSHREALRYLPVAKLGEFYRSLAEAKEVLALLVEHERSSQDQQRLKQIAAARHQLKKALLTEETNSRPLREALTAFRLICLPDEEDDKLLTQSNQEPVTEKKPSTPEVKDTKQPDTASKGSSASVRSRKPRPLRAQKPAKVTIPTRAALRVMTINTDRATPRGRDSPKRQVKFQLANSARNERKRTPNNPRSHSARERNPRVNHSKQRPVEPAPRQAWDAQDQRNLTLLRKAERNLHQVERKESRRNEESQRDAILEKFKDELGTKLREAIEHGDRAELWRALNEFERYFGDAELSRPELELVRQAKDELKGRTASQYAENLSNAVKQRNVEVLRHLIYQIDNEAPEHLPASGQEKVSFQKDLGRARMLVTQLSGLHKHRGALVAMTRPVVAQISSYPCPPESMKAVVRATFLLLGERERQLIDWPAMQTLLGKLGRLSITRRVALCDASSVTVATAKRVLHLLKDIPEDRVMKSHKAIWTFYCWAKCMSQEVLARHADEPDKVKPPTLKQPLRRIDTEFWSRLARPSDRITAQLHPREKPSTRIRPIRPRTAITIREKV